MSADSPRSSPPSTPPSIDDVRGALRALGQEAPPAEREFAARLHRRLVAAGAPPAVTWFGRLVESVREPWRELRQQRALVTGAMLGALVTATAFTLLAGPHRERAADLGPTAARGVAPVPRYLDRPNLHAERKAPHTVGDRRSLRDRMGADIGAERPERPRANKTRTR
jgi:hypothetical protein